MNPCYLHFHELFIFTDETLTKDPNSEGLWIEDHKRIHSNAQCHLQKNNAKAQRVSDGTSISLAQDGKVRRRDEGPTRGRQRQRPWRERSLSASSRSRSRSRIQCIL